MCSEGLVDRTSAEILERHGCADFCINGSGDMALRGPPRPDQLWKVGVHPEDSQALAVVIEGSGRLAIATSATYQRGAHIIDPRVGHPTTELASATVVGPDLALADGYATIVFVLGLDGLEWLDSHSGYEGYLITDEQTTHWTPGFTAYRRHIPSPESR